MSGADSSNILNRLEMSHNLRGSLQRAVTYAFEQSHREVTLEHLLLALAEDREAAVILEASDVDVPSLVTEVSDYLGHLDDRTGDDAPRQPALGRDLIHIFQSAGAAAQKSQRRAVGSALVLAAIVGEGRSTAAQILRNHGLTFEQAIMALRRANAAAAAAPQPQAAPTEEPPPSPAPAPAGAAAAAAPASTSNVRAASDILAGARERIAAVREETVAAAEARQARQRQPAAAPAPATADVTQPDEAPPAAANTAADASAAALPAEPKEAPPKAAPAAQIPPVAPQAPQPTVSETAPAAPSPPQPAPPAPKAPPPAQPRAEASAPERSDQPPPPHPPQPPPSARPLAEPRPPANPPPPGQRQRPPGPPPPRPQPAPGTRPMPSHPEELRTRPPQPAAPAPPPGWSPRNGYPVPPDGPAPDRRRPGAPRPPGAMLPVEAGQPEDLPTFDPRALTAAIPARMRVGHPTVIDVRIPRVELENWSGGGSDPATRSRQVITKAMMMRLKSPPGEFTIENGSPETQWSEGFGGPLSDDIVGWRWTVTPRRRGRLNLQISGSTRIVGRDGLAAERPFPAQRVTVRVAPDYASAVRRMAGIALVALIAAALGYFGEGLFDMGRSVIAQLTRGGA